MSDEPMKARGEPVELDNDLALELRRLDLSWLLGESYLDVSFLPALRARGHEYVLGAGVAPGVADALTPEDVEVAESRRQDVEGCRRSEESPADPVHHDREGDGRYQLDHARREVEAFRTSRPHQAELKAILLRIFGHLAAEPAGSAEIARWWPVVKVYLRVLTSPEMASRKAGRILKKLLALRAEELTERRLLLVLGRRRSPASRTSQRRSRRRRVALLEPLEFDITTARGEVRRHVQRRQR